jgi:cytochrome c peroxidase
MHDGSQATLRDVVEFYARGGTANAQLDDKMQKLELSDADKTALVAFLESL